VTLEDPEAAALLAALVALTDEDEVVALKKALEERLERVRREQVQDEVRSDELFGY
jgi:hypothetical protein